MEVIFFDQALERFVGSFDNQTGPKVFRTVDLLEEFGFTLGMPHSKKIDANLFELRIRGKQEVRIIYTFNRGTAVLLHGFIKKSEKIPERELKTARNKLLTIERV